MTGSPPAGAAPENDITRVRYVLFDFDGPICDIYAGLADITVADHLRNLITGSGVAIPDDVRQTPDPLAVFIYSAAVSAELAARVEAEMTEQELAAVPTARPNAYVHDLITSCRESRRAVAIVSNNSDRAVRAHLERHSLDDRVDMVAARTTADPGQLKPPPHQPGRCRAARPASRMRPHRRLSHRHPSRASSRSARHRLRQQARQTQAPHRRRSNSDHHQPRRPRHPAPSQATTEQNRESVRQSAARVSGPRRASQPSMPTDV